jgi:hypothetical protein
VDGERQSGVGESSTVVAGRGGNELLIRTDSERIRRTGQRLHALRVEAGRQVARSGCSAGAVGTQCWHRQYSGVGGGHGLDRSWRGWIVNRLVL